MPGLENDSAVADLRGDAPRDSITVGTYACTVDHVKDGGGSRPSSMREPRD
jgi:hypothetical protein